MPLYQMFECLIFLSWKAITPHQRVIPAIQHELGIVSTLYDDCASVQYSSTVSQEKCYLRGWLILEGECANCSFWREDGNVAEWKS